MSPTVRTNGWRMQDVLAFALLLIAIFDPKSLAHVVESIWGRGREEAPIVKAADEELLMAEQVAAKLKVSTLTVVRWGKAGKIPRIELSPLEYRYRWSEVLRALESQRPQAKRRRSVQA